jgi:ribosomal protein S27AE
MRLNLSGSSISGALLGAIGVLCYSSSRCPYCNRCGKYKELQDRNEILFEYEEDRVNEVFGRLGELKQSADYNGTVSYCRELTQKYENNKGNVKIVVEQRICPDCGQGTLLANVYRFGKKEWKEVDELRLSVSSVGVDGESSENGAA